MILIFQKKKDGFPHMGYKINKIHMKKFENLKKKEGWSILKKIECATKNKMRKQKVKCLTKIKICKSLI